VFAGIAPWNFPAMIPQGWMAPICLVTGNCRRVEAARCAVDFLWLYPPFPASCPFRSILARRGLPPSQTPPCSFPERDSLNSHGRWAANGVRWRKAIPASVITPDHLRTLPVPYSVFQK
jgi:hypothetical protein